MNLRNTTFTKCKFNHVTFNRLPEISIKEKEEGYQIAYGGLKNANHDTRSTQCIQSYLCWMDETYRR